MPIRPLLLAATLAACAPPADRRPDPRPADGTPAPVTAAAGLAVALRGADAAFARSVSARDEQAFRAFLADDALFVGPTGLLAGRDAVWARWKRLLEKDGPILRWAPTGGDGAASGDLGWTVGSSHFEGRDAAGKPVASDGEYLTVWSRNGAGPWQVAMDMELSPAGQMGPMNRTAVKTLGSRDGTLEASMGTWSHHGVGRVRSGAWLTVRERAGQGWRVVHDSAVALGE